MCLCWFPAPYVQHPHKHAAFKVPALAVVKEEFHWVCSRLLVLLAAYLQLMKLLLVFPLITKHGFDSKIKTIHILT